MDSQPRHVSVPIIWKACYELENNARDILKQGKQNFPRRDRLYYFASNINYYLSTLQQEMDGTTEPSPHWSGVWTEMQALVGDVASQYRLLSSSIDEVPDATPLTQKDLSTYPSGPWKFRNPAKVIAADAAKIKKLLLVVSMRLGRSPALPAGASSKTTPPAGDTVAGGTDGSPAGAATNTAVTSGSAGNGEGGGSSGTAGGTGGESADRSSTSTPAVQAEVTASVPLNETIKNTTQGSSDVPAEVTASAPANETIKNGTQSSPELQAEITASPPANETIKNTTASTDVPASSVATDQSTRQSSSVKPPDSKTLSGQARRLEARVGTKLVGQTAKKIQASATSLVNELQRWNLLWGEPPQQGISTIRFGGGLTPAQVLTQFYYLPTFSFTMPSYTQFSYRLPPRHKFLVHYTREAGKLINLMNREIEATSFTREQLAVARGPWSEVQNIFSDVVAHYMELYKLVNEYDDARLKKNILEDQLKFGRSIVAIHDDMDRLNRVLLDVHAIVKQ